MSEQPRPTGGGKSLQVSLSGYDLINAPRLNKGTAFSEHERDLFDLHGLLPPHIGNLEDQVERRSAALTQQPTPFSKYAFLRDLQDTNETLFYAFLLRDVEHMLPLRAVLVLTGLYRPAFGARLVGFRGQALRPQTRTLAARLCPAPPRP